MNANSDPLVSLKVPVEPKAFIIENDFEVCSEECLSLLLWMLLVLKSTL